MTEIKLQFEKPAGLKKWAYIFLIIGGLTFLYGLFTMGFSSNEEKQLHFLGVLMYNTIFWTLICNASMFFICITTLAMGGWQQTFRRIPEAISTLVPIFGAITLVIMFYIVVISHNHNFYHWLDSKEVANDPILKGKTGFLNPTFYMVWSILAIGLWSLLGRRMRKISSEADSPMNEETSRKFIWRNTVRASLFIVWFALTVASTIPWLWIMSLDPHWYSTMFSWYNFASTFVAGMSLITIWVLYLKGKGYLELTTKEHVHDLGKFMFAFSIFWTYLWFSQFMLIWYANIPEETVYFFNRLNGPYKFFFFFNLIINFVFPFLILMTRSSKRNFKLLMVVAIIIILGHWMDYYLEVMGSLEKSHAKIGLFDFGILLLFAGIMILQVAKALAKKPLITKYHPFIKESVIHEV